MKTKILLLALCLATSNSFTQVCFNPAAPVQGGSAISSVISADFNGDGRADLAVGKYVPGGNVYIFLGTGAGSFIPAPFPGAVVADPYVTSVTSADFNGDGKADLLTGSSNANNRCLFLSGNGSAIKVFESGKLLGDFNGDGKADLATGVSVLLGNGTGTFGSPIYFSNITNNLRTVASADFNGDGKVDLVTANTSISSPNNVSVFLGNGDGTFNALNGFSMDTTSSSITSADFNGDGKTDLAITSLPKNMFIFFGNGNGTFGPVVNSGKNWSFIPAVADFNGDGKADLATAVSVSIGNGDGTFGPDIYFSNKNNNTVTCADFNGDGKPDLAVGYWNSFFVSVFLNCTVAGATDLINKQSLLLYPNPSNGKFTIRNEEIVIDGYELAIYNTLGEKIYSKWMPSLKSAIDISNQPNGVYFLNITTEKELHSKKIIIQK